MTAPPTMKAVVVEEIGGPEILQFKTSYPIPTAQTGQLLVRNNLSGVNFIDTYFRTGLYPSAKPEVLGREGAGIVAALGPNTSGFQIGDRVAWLGTGGYAEYTAVSAAKTVKIPDEVSDEDVMASFLSGMTVLSFAKETYAVQKGDWVLLHAAAGGAGFLMTQILKAMGAKVIGTAGEVEKCSLVKAVQASQKLGGPQIINPDNVLPSRHRVERHGAIRLGTAHELATIRRMFAIMGMYPVGYYDLSLAGFPMHATAFRPTTQEALAQYPFRVFTTVLRMELLTERTQTLAKKALENRNIFTPRLLDILTRAEENGHLTSEECTEFIANGLETFRWHSKATVNLEEYQLLKAEHPLIADIVSFPSSHINHLTPRTIDIDLVQRIMLDRGMPAKERIEGPPKRTCPILLRQTSFKALEETVNFRDSSDICVKGSHTARFGAVEQRGYALTREGRQLYDKILNGVNVEAAKNTLKEGNYDKLLEDRFEAFPDSLFELHAQGLAYFSYTLSSLGKAMAKRQRPVSIFETSSSVSLHELVDKEIDIEL